MPAQFGSFEDLLQLTEPGLRPVVAGLRSLIRQVDAEAVEVVRLGDRAATYGIGPKKMKHGYCYILPYDNWVNLGFYQGVHLPDPENLLEGTGATMRHVKLRTVEEAREPAVRALVESAVAERRASREAG